MPSCTHDYSPSNQYFVTSAPRANHLSKAERKEANGDFDAEYDARDDESFRAQGGMHGTSKYKQISEKEKEEKEADKLRKDLLKEFEIIWSAFEKSKHPVSKEEDLMEKLRKDVEEFYQPLKHSEFEQKQAAARVLQKTKPMPSKKNATDPFAM
jgi:hypothetical protein